MPTGLDPRSREATGRAGRVQRTKDEKPVTKSCPQEKKKLKAAIREPMGFPFLEALRRRHRLRRSVLAPASNRVRQFRFQGAPPSRPQLAEGAEPTAPRVHCAARRGEAKSPERAPRGLNRRCGALAREAGFERRTTFPSGRRACGGPFPCLGLRSRPPPWALVSGGAEGVLTSR